MPEHTDPARSPHVRRGIGPLLAEVTNVLVGLHRAHYGKGPNRSKSYLIDDVLICVMGDVFTPVEGTLTESGQHDQVRQTRLALQDARRDTFTDAIETVLGRTVLGFTSLTIPEHDLQIDLFLLTPEEG